ncbi:DUF3343 domain-containing protein [Syntrophomonas curvata]
MTEKIYNYYILFPNHNEGLRAHKALKAAGIKCIIAPTPREASTSCGISLLLAGDCVDQAQKIILARGITTLGIAKIEKKTNPGFKSC